MVSGIVNSSPSSLLDDIISSVKNVTTLYIYVHDGHAFSYFRRMSIKDEHIYIRYGIQDIEEAKYDYEEIEDAQSWLAEELDDYRAKARLDIPEKFTFAFTLHQFRMDPVGTTLVHTSSEYDAHSFHWFAVQHEWLFRSLMDVGKWDEFQSMYD